MEKSTDLIESMDSAQPMGTKLICHLDSILAKKKEQGKKIKKIEIAKTLNVTKQTVTKWGNSEMYPGLLYAFQLAALLECSVNDLWTLQSE